MSSHPLLKWSLFLGSSFSWNFGILFVPVEPLNRWIMILCGSLIRGMFSWLRQCIIEKENNFKQPGERYRSWAPDRYFLALYDFFLLVCVSSSLNSDWSMFLRQERFIRRWVEALSDPRVTHEIRSIWISYWSQVWFSILFTSLFYLACSRICNSLISA